MAGFGSKLKGFFVEEENDMTLEELANMYGTNEESQTSVVKEHHQVGVEVTDITSIEQIYEIAKISDLSKSIYKVDEIKSVLPASLATSTKKESVLGMMQVSHITTEEVLEDSVIRKDALSSALESFTQATISTLEINTGEIQELENRINILKEEMNSRKLSQEQQEKIINDEVTKIDSVVTFIS